MFQKIQKEQSKKLILAEKRISQLEGKLKLKDEKLKLEKKKSKSLSDKLSRSNSLKSALKEEVSELKKNF